jgi:putative protease
MAVRRAKRGRGKAGARKAARRKAGGRGRKRAAGRKARAKAGRQKARARKRKGAARNAKGAARKKVARKKGARRAATRRQATRGKPSGKRRTRTTAPAARKTVAAAPRKPPLTVAPEPSSAGGLQPQPTQPLDAPAASGDASAEDVGTVVHYYPHVNAAIVRVERGGFGVGDTLEFHGHTTNFRQRVGHIELEHESVGSAVPGQIVGIQVSERVREHDRVRRVP